MVRCKMKLFIVTAVGSLVAFIVYISNESEGSCETRNESFHSSPSSPYPFSRHTLNTEDSSLSSPTMMFHIPNPLLRNRTRETFFEDNNYQERQRRLRNFCEKRYASQSVLKLKPVKLEHILVDEKHKILFCYVPKVACTNWKRIFMVLTGKVSNISQGLNLPSYEVHQRNLFSSLQNYSDSEVNEFLQNYTKFIFVRNPFERLLSAYRNKLEQHYDSSKYFQARFGKYIIKNFRKNPTNLSLAKGDDVSFSEFVTYLLSSDRTLYNEHWQTVEDLCHPCFVDYEFIGKYESLDNDSNFVLNYLNLNFSFPVLPKPSRTASSIQKYFRTLEKEVIYKLYRIYEMDFQLFGYDLYQSLGWTQL